MARWSNSAYRPAAGSLQVAITYEFKDKADWAAWFSHKDAKAVFDKLHTLALNVSIELWGPSPMMPEPIRSGG